MTTTEFRSASATAPTPQADALVSSAGVRRLDELVVVRVSGDDRRTWLNGQITNDVRTTQPGDAVYALVVTLKGKVVTDLFVLDRDEDLALIVSRSAADALIAQLDKYIIMEDVELSRLDDLAVLTAQGPAAQAAVEAASIANAQRYPCDRLGTGGYDLLVPRDDVDTAFAVLSRAAESVGGAAVDEANWTLASLRRGLPRFGVDFGDRQYPQEAGLRERAVSFSKGCYLGQEVVCTLESRGQLVRKLVLLDASDAPAAGTPLTLADGAEVGAVTSAMRDPATGRSLVLGYVKRAHAVVGTVVHAGGAAATIARVLVNDSAA